MPSVISLMKLLRPDRFREANLEADVAAQRRTELLGDPRGDAAGGDAARLRVADQPRDAAAHFQADLRQLRRLARACLAADDHHLMVADGGRDLLTPGSDWQFRVESDLGRRVRAGLATRQGLPQIILETPQPRMDLLALAGRGADRPQRITQAVTVGDHRQGDLRFQ